MGRGDSTCRFQSEKMRQAIITILSTNLQVNMRRSGHYFKLTPRDFLGRSFLWDRNEIGGGIALSLSLHTNCFFKIFFPDLQRGHFDFDGIAAVEAKKKAFNIF